MAGSYYTPEAYKAQRSVGYLIRYASSQVTAQIESLFEEKDISFTQYVVLMCLRDKLANSCAEICQHIKYDSGAFTRLIDQLEERGLLKRKRSTQDRRVVELALTPAGHRTLDSLIVVMAEFYNTVLADFTRKEADDLIYLLTKFSAQLSGKKSAVH